VEAEMNDIELTIELSDASNCPNRCIHCSATIPGSLVLEDIKEVLQALPSVTSVVISGGEPLVHPEFVAIAKYLKNKNIPVSLYTSGVGSFSTLEMSRYFDTIYVSLYGNPYFHNYVTQAPTYDNTHVFLIANNNVIINSPVFGVETKNLIDVAKLLELKIRLTRLLPHGRGKELSIKSRKVQLQIALDMKSKYEHVIISESLLHEYCNWKTKRTLLPNKQVIHCVAGKHLNNPNRKYVCDYIE
jgi:MoaA/NifB/PqqE/SkfB family radical SAM enzyme